MTFKEGKRNGTVTAGASGDKGEREAKLKAEKRRKKEGEVEGGGSGGGELHNGWYM